MLNNLRKTPRLNFEEFKKTYHDYYAKKPEPHPAWIPTDAEIDQTHLYQTMHELQFLGYHGFQLWTCNSTEAFWDYVIKKLGIKFIKPYTDVFTPGHPEKIQWLPNAKLNIADSCFKNNLDKTAIIYQDDQQKISKISYAELLKLINQIANSIAANFVKGDALAIDMPMTVEAVAIYLAIIKAGCAVVSIADSFAPDEIATRLKISNAKAIFTQDYYLRNNKKIEIYNKVKEASAPKAIVISTEKKLELRKDDVLFQDFISDNQEFNVVACDPNDVANILFSSGTTGEPKAIPWTHTTPIKAAMDAYFHQDIHATDIVAWPTNLGWMMGPWLIFACFINGATMALCNDAPNQTSFGKFIEEAKVTVLGLVPSIVSAWKVNKTMEQFDWSAIKCFSSSGECSSPEDYLYLSWLGNGKPIIEYCGGTEIGGAYLSSTLIQPNTPATFTTPTLGISFVMLTENHEISERIGEIALVAPSIGLSQVLLNRDHHEVYFAGMPSYNDGYKDRPLRRHGDQIEKVAEHCYRAQGRVDDTMNLGGIKTSSAEIERVLNNLPEIQETAAIAIQPKQGGPSQLVIYAICHKPIEKSGLMTLLQHEIKEKLNPLFKVHDAVIVTALPRTASNKIMRRVLRDGYKDPH